MITWGGWGDKSLDFLLTPICKDARINILEGSVRSSKTVTMIPKFLRYCDEAPDGLILITGVSKDTIYDNVLSDLFETVGSENYSYNRQTGELKLQGRRIKVLGCKDEGSEKYLRGKTLAGAYCDEISLMPESFFKQLLNRLSIEGSKLYGTTNPDSPYHYIYTDYICNEKLIQQGFVKVWHFTLDDNPNLSDEYKTFIKNAYSGLWFKRMILGLWVIADGVIYDQFNEDTMSVIDADLPQMQKYWIGCDYGTSNATVFILMGLGVDGRLYVLNEYYHSGRESLQKSPAQYSKDFKKFQEQQQNSIGAVIRPERIFIDPAAESFIVQLYSDGVKGIVQADNAVISGIELLSSIMGNDKFRVHKRCKHTLKELASYMWDAKAQKLGEDKPVKQNDHALDAIRYICNGNRNIIRSILRIA